ncbi:hypothetical protein D3C72_1629630 [compost metagenome]
MGVGISATQRSVQAFQSGTGLLQILFAVVQLAAIVAGHQEVTHGFSVVVTQYVANSEEVIQGFRHFFFVDHHHAGVHPVIDVRAVVGAARLGNFVLVVREHQIGTATVDIKMGAKLLAVHGRTFNVPTRTPCAPRRRPARFARLGHLPQHEVHRVAFHVVDFYARTGLQLIQILA